MIITGQVETETKKISDGIQNGLKMLIYGKRNTGKAFVQQVGLSTTGVGKIIKKLENNAVVYKEDNGYVLADPLLKQHILWARLR